MPEHGDELLYLYHRRLTGTTTIFRRATTASIFFRLMLAVIETKRVGPATKMMDHKRSPVSIEQGSLASLTPKRQKAGLSMSSKERKEKVGERVAALQQLVSPYGKTDTASVLLEAMEYIHFLHDQVKVLRVRLIFRATRQISMRT